MIHYDIMVRILKYVYCPVRVPISVYQVVVMCGSLSAVRLVICSKVRIAVCNMWSSGGTALRRVGGATSQFDLPSLSPLSEAGCG